MIFNHISPAAIVGKRFFKNYPELDLFALQLQKVKESLNTSEKVIRLFTYALSWAFKANSNLFSLFMLSIWVL